MKPITIQVVGEMPQSSQEICAGLLDIERWSEFQGYSILPGIAHASFERRTPEIVGSRIRVQNRDGSSHVEEIIAWDVERRVVLRFGEFQNSPLRRLAAQFVETWEFERCEHGTKATRRMTMVPTGFLGWLALLPISRLMKKAFEAQRMQMTA